MISLREYVRLAVLLVAFPLATVHAQSGQDIEAQEAALDRLEQFAAERRATEDASKYAHITGGPVTLSEVMRDPDNIKLNYRFAQTQIADRNLRGAAATLERILLVDPGQSGIRLLYAGVLYRLDSLIEAAAQLEQIEMTALSAKRQDEAKRLQDRIAKRDRLTTYWAELGGGLRFQSNANFAPDDERIDAIVATPFGPFALTVDDEGDEDDLSYVASGGAGFRHKLPFQGDHSVFGALSGLWNEQVEVDSTDYNAYSANLGIKWTGPVDVVAQGLGGYFRLDDDAFLDYYGIDLNIATDFSERVRGNIRHRTTYQDYDDASDDTAERTGALYEFEIGGRYRLTQSQFLQGSFEYHKKKARREWREYDAWIAEASHLWLPGRSIYVRNRISYGPEDYDASNPRVSVTKREDENFLYRFTISSELRGIFGFGVLPPPVNDIRVTGSATYRSVNSNIRNFEYHNVVGELIFSKRFDF